MPKRKNTYKSLVGNAFEALFGAILIDKGYEKTKKSQTQMESRKETEVVKSEMPSLLSLKKDILPRSYTNRRTVRADAKEYHSSYHLLGGQDARERVAGGNCRVSSRLN